MDRDVTDTALIERWRSGDRHAGDALLRRYEPMLFAFFRRRTGHNLDELVQRTLLACVQSLDRFEGRSTFKTYLLGIAHNQLLMNLRRNTRMALTTRLQVDGQTQAPVSPFEDSPSQLASFKEQHRILLSALFELGPDFLNVIKLFYWEGLTMEAIAAHLNVAPGTVRSRLTRARALLKAKMSSTDVPDDVSDEAVRTFLEEARPF